MSKPVIVDAVRTPIGRYRGVLKTIRPDDLASDVIKALLERNPDIKPDMIEEVVLGNANQAGEDNRNVARMSALLADLPIEVGGTTINRLCGSGMDAVIYASRAIKAGEGDVFIAGGTESMTRAPFVMEKSNKAFPRDVKIYDTTIGWRFTNERLHNKYGSDSMPKTAENVAERYNISREAQDEFAFESQMRAKRAMEQGRFQDEMMPVSYQTKNGDEVIVDVDEHPRPNTTRQKLASLSPLFEGGSVTAGNASGINDGASVLLIMSETKARALGLTPLAEYVSSGTTGVEPAIMGLGPIDATRKALKRANLSVKDIGLIELNEAFASQSLEVIRQLDLNPDIVNVNGGAIAFGHPLGASGARILTTLLHEMKKRQVDYGLATMCVGVGQGIAMVVKRPD